jgi:hypothetical protein
MRNPYAHYGLWRKMITLSSGLGTGAHQGQLFVYFKKYQKPGFIRLTDILSALQGLQQFRILLFCELG